LFKILSFRIKLVQQQYQSLYLEIESMQQM